MAKKRSKGDVVYYKPQRLWSKKAFLGYKAWDRYDGVPTEAELASGNFKVETKYKKTRYYKRIENPNLNNTIIVNERPIGYSTKADAEWLGEAKYHCSSWEELLKVLEFSKHPELIELINAYVKCDALYDEVIFPRYTSDDVKDKEWWDNYKQEMNRYYADVEAGRVSRYI